MAAQKRQNAYVPTGSKDPGHTDPSAPSQDHHHLLLRYKLASPTLKTLSAISKAPSRQDVLRKACFATEFRSFPVRQAEKGFLREVNDHTAIPYPIKEAVSQPWQKVFLLVQLDLMRTDWPNKLSVAARKELNQDRGRIHTLLDCVLRCLIDLLGERDDGRGVTTALDVLRSVKAGVWEGSEKQLLQVEGIGPVKLDRLLKAGIKSIRQLSGLEFYHIERLLSRNPPFGQKMLHQLAGFPQLTLGLEALGLYNSPPLAPNAQHTAQGAMSTSPLLTWIIRATLGFDNSDIPHWNKRHPWVTFVIEGDDGRLAWFWRGSVKRLVGGKELIIGVNAKKREELKITFACEEIVGTILRDMLRV